MVHLQINDALSSEENSLLEDASLLERAVRQTLQHTGAAPEAEISLVVTDDEQLQALNRQFLDVDAPTDVLSFPAGEETDPDTKSPYLGDILISYPRALAQAAAGGHLVREELQLLTVHGTLHLLGYDHAEEAEKAEMWAVQAAILAELGCSITLPPSS